MAHKLLEKTGAELCAALVSIAGPVRHFLDDEEFMSTLRESTKKGVRTQMEGILNIYADMVPLLFGDKHLRDTIQILATVEGKTTKEMLKMPGVELFRDAMDAWKEQIAPFFQQLGVTV